MYNKYYIDTMVRTSKPAVTPAPVAATAPVSVPVAEAKTTSAKKTSSKKAAKVDETPAPAVTATTPVAVDTTTVAAVVAAATTDAAAESNSITKLTELDAKLQQLSSILSALKSDVKVIAKTIVREQKVAQKNSKASRRASGKERQPSGFVKPTPISNELADFLGKNQGSEMARTEASKEIHQYIRTHGLATGRDINPDAKLSVLLNVQSGDKLTYFNLQRYMKHHFLKAVTATDPAATTA